MKFSRRPQEDYRKLPFEWVSEPVAKQTIADAIAPFTRDMELVRPWLWAKPLSEEHRAILSLQGYKGGVFQIEYGICCTWVPHLQAKTWRWHRTLKQTRRDLAVSHAGFEHRDTDITHLRGTDLVRRQALRAIDVVAPRATRWWASVETDEGILREALRQLASPIFFMYQAQVVAAFTAARLGQANAAREYLAGSKAWPDRLNFDGVLTLLNARIAQASST